MNPLISVIVPAYNASNVLERSIGSIIKQTYTKIEVIIIDDGSTDETPDICQRLTELDGRIKVFHQSNVGLSGARNKGVELAKGEYIAFVDADDYVSNEYIEKMYNAALRDGSDLVICNLAFGDEDSYQFPCLQESSTKCMTSVDLLSKWRDYKNVVTYAWNKLYRKKWWNNNGFKYPLGSYYEDMAIAHIVVSKANKISIINDQLYYYYQGIPTSITHDNKLVEKRISDWICYLEKRESWFRENDFGDVYRELHIQMQKYYAVFFCKLDKNSKIKAEVLDKYRCNYSDLMKLTDSLGDKAFFTAFRYCPLAVRGGYVLFTRLGIPIKALDTVHG